MGCGTSTNNGRLSEGCLVGLCKERKDLIRAARDCRYALAESHVLYLRSLLDLGEALDVFLKEAAVVNVGSRSSSSVDDSPIHSDEGSHLELSSVDSESVFLGSLTDEVHQGEEDGRLKLSASRPAVNSSENESRYLEGQNVSYMMRSPAEAVVGLHEPAQVFPVSFGEEYGSYMPPIYHHPNGFVHYNYWFPVDGTGAYTGGPIDASYNGYGFPAYRDGSSFSFPASSSVYSNGIGEFGNGRSMDYFGNMPHDYHQPYVQPNPNPIPSPPMANSMDYFNISNFTDDFYSSYDYRNLSEVGLGSEYHDLNYLHEEEGIPPLEEVEEDTSNPKSNNASEAVRGTHADAINDTSNSHASLDSDEGKMAGDPVRNQSGQREEFQREKTSIEKDNNAATTSPLTDEVQGEADKRVVSSSEDDKIVDEAEPPGRSREDIITKRPCRDILDAMQEISHSFVTAYDSGKEVTEILEAGKIPYISTGSILKGFYHRILGAIEPSTMSLLTTYMLRKQSVHKMFKLANGGSSDVVKNDTYGLGMMQSTLDKIYMWERKLHREIKIEEDLRAVYDKLCKRSRMLVNEGAECDKIAAVQEKIKRLLPKINVSVSAVRAISRSIQQTRDDELCPQISELIHGLSRMSKSMSECHDRQIQAAVDAEERLHVPKLSQQLKMEHTEDLKLKVLRCRSCLCDMINTQRAFFTFLNEWLSKSLKEETEDGVVPFSPGRMGAPQIFISCHDWLHAMEPTSGSRASEALQEFASALHNLWAKQSEAETLRLRVEFLKGWIRSTSSIAESHSQPANTEEVSNARRSLQELKAAHVSSIEKVATVFHSCLKDGLVPVFGALKSLCADMSNAYDQIRVP
uniref:BZIP transcription factor n=1 Tax=Kalanchoe fedtschenkoi TaxID=63787 RepID=A0A7N0TBC4_KALFE